jgi:hypothetical protein
VIARRGTLTYPNSATARGAMLTGTTGWADHASEPCDRCDDRGWLPPLGPGKSFRRCPRCCSAYGTPIRISPYVLMMWFGHAWRQHRDLLR